MSGYELLYVVPTEKTNKGKNSACLVLRKGNQEPQKQYQSAESYMVNWQEELEEETKRKAEVTSLYQTKNGGRGKVYLMPNQQIFIPISILPGKGNSTGYVSLKDVTGISQGYNGNGMIRFLEGRISLQTHMAVDSLFDRVNKAKSTYCEGFKPADLVMELITEKEKVQCALSQPNGLGADILHVGKSLTLATLDFLRQVPIEKLPEVIGDLCRKMGRVDEYWRDKKMDWLRAYIYTMVGHTATKEDVKKALELADRPETIPQENPTEIRRKYWPSFCKTQTAESETTADETLHRGKLIFNDSYVDMVRHITARPEVSALTKMQPSVRSLTDLSPAMEAAQQQERYFGQMARTYRYLNNWKAIPGVITQSQGMVNAMASANSLLDQIGRTSLMFQTNNFYDEKLTRRMVFGDLEKWKGVGVVGLGSNIEDLIHPLNRKKLPDK